MLKVSQKSRSSIALSLAKRVIVRNTSTVASKQEANISCFHDSRVSFPKSHFAKFRNQPLAHNIATTATSRPCTVNNGRFLSTAATAPYDHSTNDVFPSLIVGANGSIEPRGSFAEAQAQFLEPDMEAVSSLSSKLIDAKMGIVAHYYMDVELQGVLHAINRHQLSNFPNDESLISIADSLAMGDHAVRMVENAGVTSIACLGVDFMAESVAAILERNGHGNIPVYRAAVNPIGCSLAESAERDSYRAWLQKGRESNDRVLHVVYINTSLETKAVSTSIVPTVTCTSSNVLQTMLNASAQIPDLTIMYGPDTYMGDNLVALFDAVLGKVGGVAWDDERIKRELHPAHNQASIRKLRDSIDVYPSGNCVVHHMFGSEVVRTVKEHYDDAYVTAHLEVPGEMFEIALEKSLVNRGVVGSTSNILNFISEKVDEAAAKAANVKASGDKTRLKFILGTEAGMVTSIVKSVQEILARRGCDSVEAEIVFPVAAEAVMGVEDEATGLSVVPGAGGGEGCSTAGGCATCPFMKMNDLDALNDVVDMVLTGEEDIARLRGHLPPDRLQGKMLGGVKATDLGSEPILHMRHFMKEGSMSDDLVRRITNKC